MGGGIFVVLCLFDLIDGDEIRWLLNAVGAVLMSGFILYQTSLMVNGGETNYILATIGLYVSIYNLFTSLLHLLGVAADD